MNNSLYTFCVNEDNHKMNHIRMILLLLTLSSVILGKSVLIADEDAFPRYAFNYAINDPYAREEKNGNLFNGDYPLLEPDRNLQAVYSVNDYVGFNSLIQKLAASLTPLQLLGPLPLPLPPVNPLIDPLNYGFGAKPLSATFPNVKIGGSSIPWDPKTRSYGGWVPLRGPVSNTPAARLVRKQYVNGRLYKVRSKPISLTGKKIVIKRKVVSV